MGWGMFLMSFAPEGAALTESDRRTSVFSTSEKFSIGFCKTQAIRVESLTSWEGNCSLRSLAASNRFSYRIILCLAQQFFSSVFASFPIPAKENQRPFHSVKCIANSFLINSFSHLKDGLCRPSRVNWEKLKLFRA